MEGRNFGIEDAGQRLTRLVMLLAYLLGAVLAAMPVLTHAQTQSNIQYTYDAAGNLIGVTNSPLSLPDLTVSNLSIGIIGAVGNGSYTIPVVFQVNNVGTAPAVATWYDRGYLSSTAILYNADQALSGFTTRSTNLAAGASYTVSTTYTTSTTTTPGIWYLIVKADGGAAASGQYSPTGPNYVAESNEYNNTQAVTINLLANPKPDLTLSNGSIGAITVTQAGAYSFPVTFTVKNIGEASAPPTWYDAAYLSSDGMFDNSSVVLGDLAHSTALASGSSYNVSLTASTSTTTAPGAYTVYVKADGRGFAPAGGTPTDNGNVTEANETNNTQALPITLPVRPDFTVSNGSIGAITVNQNGSYSFPVTFTVNNIGGSSAPPTWYDAAYLSSDGSFDNSSVVLGDLAHSSALASGSSYNVSLTATTSTTTAPGAYTVYVKADGRGFAPAGGTPTDNGNVAEASETNNTQALAITLPALPDFTVSNLSVGTIIKNSNGSHSIPVTFTVNNTGASSAPPTWYDAAYLSSDGAFDNSSVEIGYLAHTSALASGSSYNVSFTATTSTTAAPGAYTVYVKADGRGFAPAGGTPTDNGNVKESNETNNTASASVVLQ